MNIFISTSTFGLEDDSVFSLLKRHSVGYKLNDYGRKLTEKEIKNILLSGNYAGLIAGTEPLTDDVLKNSSLKVISRVGTGLDNVDLVSAKKNSIRIYNTPEPVVDAVSELTVALVLCALRKINLLDRDLKNGVWDKKMGLLLKNKIVGIVGFGKIGRAVAQKLRSLEAEVIFYDKNTSISSKEFKRNGFEKLIKTADIITLHANSKEQILGKKELKHIKEGAIIINTARGNLIDEKTLFEALKTCRISCACLDVFEKEPYKGKLTKLDNVILTPHIGSYAKEARIRMEKEAVENLIKGFKEVGLL